jgi:hypothetical protein
MIIGAYLDPTVICDYSKKVENIWKGEKAEKAQRL